MSRTVIESERRRRSRLTAGMVDTRRLASNLASVSEAGVLASGLYGVVFHRHVSFDVVCCDVTTALAGERAVGVMRYICSIAFLPMFLFGLPFKLCSCNTTRLRGLHSE
jgi:hypothetical protein